MILYVGYGLLSGDRAAEDRMIGHLVSLAALIQDAGLSKSIGSFSSRGRNEVDEMYLDNDWLLWAMEEERKRTYFSFFYMASSLTTYLNTQSFLEIRDIDLSLPSDEDLWEAQSAASWREIISSNGWPQPSFREHVVDFFSNNNASNSE